MKAINSIGVVGLGWLGKKLGEALQQSGKSVWGTVRGAEKRATIQKEGKLNCIEWSADVGVAPLKSELSQTDLLIITLPPSGFDLDTYLQTIEDLIDALPEAAKVLYTSSTGVYQDLPVWQKETSEDLKDNAVAKADQLIRTKFANRSCILRLGGLIGEDRNPVKYLTKKDVNFNPNEPVHLIHRNDIIAVVKKVINDNAFGNVFNVVNPARPSRKTYYSSVAVQLGYAEPRFTDENASKGKRIDTNKLEKELEFNTFTPLLQQPK